MYGKKIFFNAWVFDQDYTEVLLLKNVIFPGDPNEL